jgi:hypothetical protein
MTRSPDLSAGSCRNEAFMKLTRQGVPDLNPRGVNGHRTRRCRHFYGPHRIVGHEWVFDPYCFESYQREIYGRSCIHCGEVAP